MNLTGALKKRVVEQFIAGHPVSEIGLWYGKSFLQIEQVLRERLIIDALNASIHQRARDRENDQDAPGAGPTSAIGQSESAENALAPPRSGTAPMTSRRSQRERGAL